MAHLLKEQEKKGPIAMIEAEEAVIILKALADETRVLIVEMLSCGERCACQINQAFCITQPTLSYHLNVLTKCNLVDARKDGMRIWYSLNQPAIDDFKAYLDRITSDTEDCSCKRVEQRSVADGSDKCGEPELY